MNVDRLPESRKTLTLASLPVRRSGPPFFERLSPHIALSQHVNGELFQLDVINAGFRLGSYNLT